MAPSLPPDRENQTYVSAQALLVGGLSLPHMNIFQDRIEAPLTERYDIPFIAGLITHPSRGKALFDLGLRKHAAGYPPKVQPEIDDYFRAYCNEDMADVLKKGGVEATDIKTVILSHLHWDHVGDPTLFTSAEFVVGASCKHLLDTAYPTDPNSVYQAIPSTNKVTYIDFAPGSQTVSPFATFEHAFDIYGDGSLYIVDAPGHMPGHIAAVARVAPNSFVLFAGDTCHHRQAYNPGTRLISENMYEDIATARATVKRLAELNKEHENAIVVLAHEIERLEEMPFFPSDLKEWVVGEIEKRKQRRVAVTAGAAS